MNRRFVVDGLSKELTPAQILSELCPADGAGVEMPSASSAEPVVDETVDPKPGSFAFDQNSVQEYLDLVKTQSDSCTDLPRPFAGALSKAKLATALIDAIWSKGAFRLEDLTISPKWQWRSSKMGDLAALYDSVQSVADYVDALDLRIGSYSLEEGQYSLKFKTNMAKTSAQPHCFVPDPQSWIIYVPFETSDYRLGGSILSQVFGDCSGVAPQMTDPDYFIDCYEVIREMVEDGILLSGATVGQGGLVTALDSMTSDGVGASVDFTDMRAAYPRADLVHLLFAEVPGAIIQIKDMDFDYVDAELLLQDVVYFPLGHPDSTGKLHVKSSSRTGIQSILEALIRNQNAEGED